MHPLHPDAGAVRVLASGKAQVIGQTVELVYTDKRVVTGRGRNGLWAYRGRASSNGYGSGPPALKKYQALRDCWPEPVNGGDLSSIRANPPQNRGIHDSRRENMRLCQTECLGAYRNELRVVHVALRRAPVSTAAWAASTSSRLAGRV